MDNLKNLYQENVNRANAISSLITFGAELFKSSYIIQNLKTLEEILEKHGNNPNDLQLIGNQLTPFIFEKLIDDIKIVTCFENIMKSELIYKGIIVHIIDGNLKQAQYSKPVKIEQIISLESTGNTLTNNTIQVSQLLKKRPYYECLSITEEIRNALIKLNNGRNQLHLLESYSTSFSLNAISDLHLMNSYVDKLIERIKGSA